MTAAIATKRPVGAGGSSVAVEPEDEELTDVRRVAAMAVKIVDFKVSSGASGRLDGPVSADLSEDVIQKLRLAVTPGSFLDQKMSPLVGATQAAAARSSPGREDSSVLKAAIQFPAQPAKSVGSRFFTKIKLEINLKDNY
jgi:hypothetical protein